MNNVLKWITQRLTTIGVYLNKGWNWLVAKMSDARGKPKIGYNTSKRVYVLVSIFLFVTLAVFYFFTDRSSRFATLEPLRRQLAENDGVRGRPVSTSKLDMMAEEESDIMKRIREKTENSTNQEALTGTEISPQVVVPSVNKCLDLLERLSKNEEFSLAERTDLNICIDKNPMGWSEGAIGDARIAADPDIPEAAREKARESIAKGGKPYSEKINDELAKGDEPPADKGEVKGALGDLKKVSDISPPVVAKKIQKNRLEQPKGPDAPESSPVAKGPGQFEELKERVGNAVENLKSKAKEVEDAEAEAKDAEERLKEANAFKDVAAAKPLSEESMYDMANLANLRKKIDELKSEQKAMADEYSELRSQLGALIDEVKAVEKDGEGLVYTRKGDAKKVESVISEESLPKKPNVSDVLKGDNPEVRLKMRRAYAPDNQKYTASMGWGGGEKTESALNLPKTMRLLAVVEKFTFSTEQEGQIIRCVLISSIIDPATGLVKVPKKSVLIANAKSFSAETGKMEVTFTEAWVGSEKIKISLRVGAADGSMGLSGNVTDTRGRKLLATWIGAFINGTAAWFSEAILREYEDTKDMATALIGASLNGVKDVAEKQTQTTISDLQNSPLIFNLPENTPVILYP